MNELTELAFGERVAELRRQNNMSQKELAAQINRSESWVSQVERGAISVDRLPVLQSLAAVLNTSLQQLRPEMSHVVDEQPIPVAESNLEGLRLAITGYPGLRLLFEEKPDTDSSSLETLSKRLDQAWEHIHAFQLQQATQEIIALLPILEIAAESQPRKKQPETHRLRARLYQLLAAMFARQGEADAAWVAADRAVNAARDSGHTLEVIAGHLRMAHAFLGLKQYQQAEYAAQTAIDVLQPHIGQHDVAVEMLSLYGALHLALAVIKAREGTRITARTHIQTARQIAKRLGQDRNDYNTEFGPTNVEIHAVSVAVDVGDAGEALDIASTIDTSRLSPERQARLLLDCAQAHTQRRQVTKATETLLELAQLAPEMIRNHPTAQATINELIQLAGKHVPTQLVDLVSRAGATP